MERIASVCTFALLLACAPTGADAAGQGVAVSELPQLFLDDHVVAKLENLERKVIQPEKHPANPLIVPDQPWERRYIQTYGTVLFDAAAGRFRAWYLASDDPKAKGPAANRVAVRGHLGRGPAYRVASLTQRERTSRPPAPFATSSLQQAEYLPVTGH